MKRRNFIVTLLGGLAAALGVRTVATPKIRNTQADKRVNHDCPARIKHTILPPPADTTGYKQYVTIDPANVRHAISYWASSDPPKVIPPGYFNPSRI